MVINMKKVLLIGELNQTVSSVNKYLSTRFQTQLCVDSLELVKGMTKVFEPDMVVICLVGTNNLDVKILDFFTAYHAQLPILLIGTSEECRVYDKYYKNDKIDFVVRPTTLSELMKKCSQLLQIENKEPEAAKQIVQEKTPGKRRVLVVDDSGVLLRSVKTILEKDYSVSVATSGIIALKQIKKNAPDLILLDYEMPEWDGKRTLEEIRKDDEIKDIPVVFLTGVADKEHISAVLGLKPEGYLLKPVDPQKLINTIESVLAGTI